MASVLPNDERADAVRSSEIAAAPQFRAGVASHAANGSNEPARMLRERLLATIPSDRIDRLSEVDLRLELERIAEEMDDGESSVQSYDKHEALVNQVVDEIRGYGPLGD